MINSITLLGSSSGRNAGDAALLSAIMDGIDEAVGERLEYEIPSLNTEFVRLTYKNNVRPVGIMPWHASLKLLGLPTYQSLQRTDLSLIFDATLFDRALYNPYFNFLSSYDLLLPHAKKRGKKMGCYTVTVGPVRTPKGKDMLKRVLEMMDFITVRDQDAVDVIHECGVENENILITNDCALCTKPASAERVKEIWRDLGHKEGREVIALNINRYFDTWAGLDKKPLSQEEFLKIYVEGVSRALKDIDADVLFISTQHMDEELTRELMNRVKTPHRKMFLSNRRYDHFEIRGVMAEASLLFAMRLHCLILTAAGHTPIASLNYLPKVDNFMRSLGLEDYSLGFNRFSTDSVADYVLRGWNDRAKIRQQLDNLIPEMQRQAAGAAEIVAGMRRGEDVATVIRRLKEPAPESLAARQTR